jgi:sigma-B regulation protein RsbU (phosphoserine phosphatase)
MKQLSECRILLVDDAKPNIDILVAALKNDYKLSVALNGEMALQIAERTPPDLVLLDIMMPGLDGYEVCRRFRKMPEMADVPVIFLSSLDEVAKKAQGFEAGANDYVTKPFEILEVQARVRSLIKAKAYSDSVKEQLAADLRVAHDIQMGMIPQDFTTLEKEFGVELAAALDPAREVGGDLYCAFAADPDRLVLVMGDVSGKGIPASLFMVRTSTLVRLLARQIREPDLILAALNDELSAENPSLMFCTMVCAVFDRTTRHLVIASAGHTKPVLLRTGQSPEWIVSAVGTALGFESGFEFPPTEVELHPGDAIVLYTDGVSEAFNPQRELYGNDRLLRDIAASTDKGAPAVVSQMLQHVRGFADGAPQSDDIAVLALRLRDSSSGAAS